MPKYLLLSILLTLSIASCGKDSGIFESDKSSTCLTGSFRLTTSESDNTWSTGERQPVSAEENKSMSSEDLSSDCKTTSKASSNASVDHSSSMEESASIPRSGSDTDSSGRSSASAKESDGAGNNQQNFGILTAGRFDDSLNLDSLYSFWDEQNVNRFAEGLAELPDKEELQLPERFSGQQAAGVEISFVIDATGSMQDELSFIQNELQAISDKIKESYPNVEQKFSLIVYRDKGDQYVTKGISFTSDIEEFKSFLSEQRASGGGDFPEAMDVALSEANEKLQWSDSDEVAKVLFLIADAPPHNLSVEMTLKALDSLASKSVHVYPIASSGIDPLAEKVMRYGALFSGGEYIFLTDDSGVGNAHAEPHIPCYHVQKLFDLVVDVLDSEIKGQAIFPNEASILRTVGNPVAGVCQPEEKEQQ